MGTWFDEAFLDGDCKVKNPAIPLNGVFWGILGIDILDERRFSVILYIY